MKSKLKVFWYSLMSRRPTKYYFEGRLVFSRAIQMPVGLKRSHIHGAKIRQALWSEANAKELLRRACLIPSIPDSVYYDVHITFWLQLFYATEKYKMVLSRT